MSYVSSSEEEDDRPVGNMPDNTDGSNVEKEGKEEEEEEYGSDGFESADGNEDAQVIVSNAAKQMSVSFSDINSAASAQIVMEKESKNLSDYDKTEAIESKSRSYEDGNELPAESVANIPAKDAESESENANVNSNSKNGDDDESGSEAPDELAPRKLKSYGATMTVKGTLHALSKTKPKKRLVKLKRLKAVVRKARPASAPVQRRPDERARVPEFTAVVGDSSGNTAGPKSALSARRGDKSGRQASARFLRNNLKRREEDDRQMFQEIRREQEKLDESVIAQMVEATRWSRHLGIDKRWTPVFSKSVGKHRGDLQCEVVNGSTVGKKALISVTLFHREHQKLKESHNKHVLKAERLKARDGDRGRTTGESGGGGGGREGSGKQGKGDSSGHEDANRGTKFGRSARGDTKPRQAPRAVAGELRKLLDETQQLTGDLKAQLDELRFRGWNAHLFEDVEV